jgi:hypothetical protein
MSECRLAAKLVRVEMVEIISVCGVNGYLGWSTCGGLGRDCRAGFAEGSSVSKSEAL